MKKYDAVRNVGIGEGGRSAASNQVGCGSWGLFHDDRPSRLS
jgi:hypothetical protein